MNNSNSPKPKYSADVPEFILTPDKVETESLGDLEFFDGLPSEATVKKAYDFLDLSRGAFGSNIWPTLPEKRRPKQRIESLVQVDMPISMERQDPTAGRERIQAMMVERR